jgi:hypothetical protein
MTDERRDELSTADLAGQRPATGRADDHADHADRLDDDAVGARQATLTDERSREDTVATDRADLADTRDAERADAAPAVDGDRDRVDDVAASGTTAPATAGSATGPLLATSDAEGFRARWTDVQTGFVDAPREAVEHADGLVAEVMQHLAKTFADERNGLERQWDRGDEVSTDDLRTAFQRYRSFFERLLST